MIALWAFAFLVDPIVRGQYPLSAIDALKSYHGLTSPPEKSLFLCGLCVLCGQKSVIEKDYIFRNCYHVSVFRAEYLANLRTMFAG